MSISRIDNELCGQCVKGRCIEEREKGSGIFGSSAVTHK